MFSTHMVEDTLLYTSFFFFFFFFCKNIFSVKHILLESPITTELFQKNLYDLNACNNVIAILYNTDVINHIVKLIVHSPEGKLV